jgi:hypothetical protein
MPLSLQVVSLLLGRVRLIVAGGQQIIDEYVQAGGFGCHQPGHAVNLTGAESAPLPVVPGESVDHAERTPQLVAVLVMLRLSRSADMRAAASDWALALNLRSSWPSIVLRERVRLPTSPRASRPGIRQENSPAPAGR